MNETDKLAWAIADQHGFLTVGMAQAIARTVIRLGYRKEQSAPEPATSDLRGKE